MPYPKLDKKKSIVWPFVKKLLQASFLLWELVVDLPNIHWLQIGVAVAWIGLANVNEQVLVKLERQKKKKEQKCLSGAKKGKCAKMLSVQYTVRLSPLYLYLYLL